MVPAGSKMTEGGGLAIPAHGLGLVFVQVRLVPVVPGRPRASMIAPVAGYDLAMRMACKMPQIFGADAANMLASMKDFEPTQQLPDAG